MVCDELKDVELIASGRLMSSRAAFAIAHAQALRFVGEKSVEILDVAAFGSLEQIVIIVLNMFMNLLMLNNPKVFGDDQGLHGREVAVGPGSRSYPLQLIWIRRK